jgi:hypothetical protein
MTETEIKSLFEAYSRGEISRPELGRRIGRELSFGELVAELRQRRLTLPRFQADQNSDGSRLIRELAARGPRVG